MKMDPLEKELREALSRNDEARIHELASEVGMVKFMTICFSSIFQEICENHRRYMKHRRKGTESIWTALEKRTASKKEELAVRAHSLDNELVARKKQHCTASKTGNSGLSSNIEQSDSIFRRQATATSASHAAKPGSCPNTEVNVLEEADHEIEERVSELTPLFSRDALVSIETVGLRRRPRQLDGSYSYV